MPRRVVLAACLAAVLALAGCSEPYDPAADNHGYGWTYDVETASGVRLRYDGTTPDAVYDPAWFDFAWPIIQACAGLEAAAPLVVVVPPARVAPSDGWTYLDTGLVLVAAGHEAVFVHEAIHYLLSATGFPADRNTDHDSPLFTACR